MERDAWLTCPSGHMLNAAYHLMPTYRPAHCPHCGDPTFYSCPACQTEIPGVPVAPVRDGFVPVLDGTVVSLPAFCTGCGKAFPWTEDSHPSQGVISSGQQFDAFKRILEVVARAKHRLRLVDNWVDPSVLDTFSAKPPGVSVQILTKNAAPALRAAVSAFLKQHKGLEVRLTTSFHDRFLFVDDTEVWAFGASLKDAGKAVSFYTCISEPAAVRALDAEWNIAWASGTAL